MPGKLMSMSTTSGLVLGNDANASSPEECSLTHLKPSDKSINRARLVRTRLLSSTMETRMLIGLRFFLPANSLVLIMFTAASLFFQSPIRVTGEQSVQPSVPVSYTHLTL